VNKPLQLMHYIKPDNQSQKNLNFSYCTNLQEKPTQHWLKAGQAVTPQQTATMQMAKPM